MWHPLQILVSISDHRICPGSGETPEKSPGSLRPQPWASSRQGLCLGVLSLQVHPAEMCQGEGSAHGGYQPQACPTYAPRPTEEAPSPWRCLQAWGPSWALAPLVLVFQQAWKGGDCEGNRTSSFPALSPTTKLGYKRLAKPGGATSKRRRSRGCSRHGAGGGMARGRMCTRGGKAQSTRSNTELDSLPSTALPHRTRQRKVAPPASHRAEASHAAAAPRASPKPILHAVTYAACSGCELLRTAGPRAPKLHLIQAAC